MKKVLIVEDSYGYYSRYKSDLEDLGDKVQMLLATNIDRAWQLFNEHRDVAAIVMDACMGSQEPNTVELIRRIRETGYMGHIIANSNTPSNCKILLEAGCDIEFLGDKIGIVDQLLKLIGVVKPARGKR